MIIIAAAALILAAFGHAWLRPGSEPVTVSVGLALLCVFLIFSAAGFYWHLIVHGWLTPQAYSDWRDVNTFNLVVALFEPLALFSMICFLANRQAFFRTLLIDFAVIQALLILTVVSILTYFWLTWKPRLF